MTLYDDRGHRVDLEPQGQSGGEGTVHRICGDASRVAKIYHSRRLSADLHSKLRVMLEQPPVDPSWNAARHRSIAWVDGLLFADAEGRDIRGFTMPAVDTTSFRQAHAYYDADDRLRMFGGEFTWRHLFVAAHNLASAVAAVHAAGHRVGDLRETNLLVAPSSLVTLIDCDSFQIRDPRTGTVHPTRVATGDYLPPELQGIDFSTQQPDRYHGDLFALAVLVFRFLMLGVHPFQSRGSAVADAPTTEAKIRKGIFAFAGRHRGADPPEYAPPYSIVPSAVQDLLGRAFVRGHRDADARPTAGEWVAALESEGKRLRTCAANTNHWYAHGARTCPWCRLAPDPFPGRTAVGHQIALPGASGQVPEATRVEQLRAYARVALADGAVTDAEFRYLRKTGGELGLRTAVVDRVVDDESRRRGGRPSGPPPTPPAPTARPRTRDVLLSRVRSIGDRRVRSAVKAASPTLLVCALSGALAPVIAPVLAAVVVLPALATLGDTRAAPGWRARAKVPVRFVVHIHHAVGHAARLFVPLALLGVALSFAPGLRIDWVVRGVGAVAVTALGWFALARLPFAPDGSAPGIRAGRDVVWRSLVGVSGRARRPVYVLWCTCAAGAFALGANYVLWWPLTMR